MADKDRKDEKRKNAAGSENEDAEQNKKVEKDDVAEDRNLSGSSTWLTLPEQPTGDRSAEDTEKRQSNR